jgi:L-ribulokinase
MPQFSLGLDFGTNSLRALLVDCSDGKEVGSAIAPFTRHDEGVATDSHDHNLARQHPIQYTEALEKAVPELLKRSGVDTQKVVGIGVDTTGSTPLPVDQDGVALALHPHLEGHLAAWAWLWKDHTSHAEAEKITEQAIEQGKPYLAKCGGTYSSEWYWSKVLHCARTAPDIFDKAYTWMECCDYVVSLLTGFGIQTPRSVCAAGHKGMYSDSWGGYPDEEFLASISPGLARARRSLPDRTFSSDHHAGSVSSEMSQKTGLPSSIPVAVGILDAHAGAIGSGVAPGRMVKIIGTSTCDILVGTNVPDIEGVAGIVEGSVIPGMTGIEAGQSAVGDIFAWWSRVCGRSQEDLTQDAEKLRAGQSGLIALDWNNGNRNVLTDPLLTGLIVGQTLHTNAAEIYRALIEATAFGALAIINRIQQHGVQIDEIVACGGIAEKSPLTMQIYADVLNRPIRLSRSSQASALGAAILGSVVGGAHPNVPAAQQAMAGFKDLEYAPNPQSAAIYKKVFSLYELLHNHFGSREDMQVMKQLIKIKGATRDHDTR